MLIAAVLVVGAASLATAQQPAGEAEWRKAARAEREKKMRHLDVTINTVADPNSAPQAQFRDSDSVYVHVGATNTDREQTVVVLGNAYHHYFPRLLKDGRPLPYSQKAKERLADTSEPVRVKRSGVKLEPHVEERIGLLPLSFWYDKLEPGTYHLTLRFALDRTDRKVKTNTVMFEVVR
jgi:hypothetical protein